MFLPVHRQPDKRQGDHHWRKRLFCICDWGSFKIWTTMFQFSGDSLQKCLYISCSQWQDGTKCIPLSALLQVSFPCPRLVGTQCWVHCAIWNRSENGTQVLPLLSVFYAQAIAAVEQNLWGEKTFPSTDLESIFILLHSLPLSWKEAFTLVYWIPKMQEKSSPWVTQLRRYCPMLH